MSLFFILLTSISASAGPVVIPLGKNGVIGVEDINQLKIMFLLMAISGMASLMKLIWNWVTNKDRDFSEKVVQIEEKQETILKAIGVLEIHLNYIKDSQVVESEIRYMIRDEMNYAKNKPK